MLCSTVTGNTTYSNIMIIIDPQSRGWVKLGWWLVSFNNAIDWRTGNTKSQGHANKEVSRNTGTNKEDPQVCT